MHQAERVKLDRLLAAEWNANRVPDKILRKIRRSIGEFGFVENLVARPHPLVPGKLEVLSGNHRLGLLAEMGVEEVPVVVVELDDADARILAQALNRTRGEDDPEAYALLLDAVLAQVGADRVVEFLPETPASLERVLATLRDPVDADEVPESPVEAESKLGEVYELGAHRLMCGDATDREQVAELVSGTRVDLIVTDPPYGVSYQGGAQAYSAKRRVRTIMGDGDARLYAATLPLMHELLRPNGALYLWFSDSRSSEVLAALADAGFRQRAILIWAKDVPSGPLTAHYIPRHEPLVYASKGAAAPRFFGPTNEVTLWEHPKPRVNDLHPTQKPVAILERAIRNSSCPDETVLDLFAGSGSTLIAAEVTGRRCFAMELDPRYCDVIRRRYERFVGGATP